MTNYLSVENLTQNWGDIRLFDSISFGLSEGQKVALIARNRITSYNVCYTKLLRDGMTNGMCRRKILRLYDERTQFKQTTIWLINFRINIAYP